MLPVVEAERGGVIQGGLSTGNRVEFLKKNKIKMSNRKHRDNQEICARKVRELAQSGVNKHCFECGQPGVTYTDVTVGSFVCTSCSGML